MIETDESTADADRAPRRSENRRRAIAVSVMFHLVLVTGLLFWYLPQHSPSTGQGGTTKPASSRNRPNQIHSDTMRGPSSGENVAARDIEASLNSALKQAEGLSGDRKLSELERNLRRLDSISSAESVQETTERIANTLGLSPGPVPTAGSVEARFDTSTAQIHEVSRIRGPDGDWLYQSVLVDSAGRTEKVVLPRAEGEVTYNTFQQLKNFPIADGIYRKLVMPMLQNMLTAMEAAEAKARELRRQETQNAAALQNAKTQELGSEGQRFPASVDEP